MPTTPHRRKVHFASAGDRCAALLDGQHQTPQVLGPTAEYVAAGEPGVVVRRQARESSEVK